MKMITRHSARWMIGLLALWVTACGGPDLTLRLDPPVEGPVQVIRQHTWQAQRDSAGRWHRTLPLSAEEVRFDSLGHRTELLHYRADSSLQARYVYTYDRKGRRTTEQRYNLDGALTHTKRYSYSWVQPQAKAAVLAPDSTKKWREELKFNDYGLLSHKQVYGPDDQLNLEVSYRYDRKRRLTSYKGVHTLTYRYTDFDSQGNWTRRTETRDEQEQRITEREITYRDE